MLKFVALGGKQQAFPLILPLLSVSCYPYYPCYLFHATLASLATLLPLLPMLPRWSTGGEQGGKGEDSVMNQHYLRNLSIEVLLANSGFNAKNFNHYTLPRGRAGKLTDDHVKRLIEHIYPDLYAKVIRAKAAFDGTPEFETDAVSTTNMRFLQSLQICTLFWLQDAVVLIDRIPELIDIAPWNLLTDGGSVTADFERLGTDVQKAIDSSDIIQQGKLMDQTDLLRSVQSGCVQTANALDSRLSTVPSDVMIGMLEVWNREHEERRAQVIQDVMYANQQSWRRMIVAGSGEAVPPQSRGRRPFNAETPSRRSQAPSNGDTVSSPLCSPYGEEEDAQRQPFNDGEEEDGEEDSPEEVAGGSSSSRPPPSEEVAGGSSSSRPPPEEVAGGSSSSRSPSEQVAGGSSRRQSGIAGGGSRIPGGSRPPVQQEVQDYFARIQAQSQQRQSQQAWSLPQRQMPPPLLPTKKRKSKPEPSSSVTGPRGDGFYLGNDLNTVAQVWGAYQQLQTYIGEHPEKQDQDSGMAGAHRCAWACTDGDQEEKKIQCRLRARRRLLWDAICNYSGNQQELVEKLDQIQEALRCGITRVETWAETLKKRQRINTEGTCNTEGSSSSTASHTILSIAEEYESSKQSHVQVGARPSGV